MGCALPQTSDPAPRTYNLALLAIAVEALVALEVPALDQKAKVRYNPRTTEVPVVICRVLQPR